jgi:integrase
VAENRLKLTKASVAPLACPPGEGVAFFWDAGLPGFGVCARATGRRTWVVQFRVPDGRSRRMSLGDLRTVTLEKARAKAVEHLSRAKLGEDPHAERKAARRAVKLAAIVGDYLADVQAKLRPRSYEEVERHLRSHAAPLHQEPVGAIDRAAVVRLLTNIRDTKGPVAANRVRASLSALWTWGLSTGRIEGENPVAHTPKPAKETARERVLSDAEIALLWRCTGRDHDHDRIVRLLLLTGARREEVGGMAWAELEATSGGALWTLPAARSKNGLPHEVPLGPLAAAQLPPKPTARQGDGAAGPLPRQMVFGKLGSADTDGPRTASGFSGWSRCKERLDARMLAALREDFAEAHGREPRDGECVLTPWVLHDLRRTFSTWANESGVEPHVVEAVLNHVSGAARRGVAGTYNKALYRAQKAAALAAWEAHVRAVAGLPGEADNVVALRKVS